MRNILSKRNEKKTGVSSLTHVVNFVRGEEKFEGEISDYFLEEFINLFKGVNGKADISSMKDPEQLNIKLLPLKASLKRSKELDEMAKRILERLQNIPHGLHPQIIEKRNKMKEKILYFFDSSEENWKDWNWHLERIIRDSTTLKKIISLSIEEERAVEIANRNFAPFGITPYYLSLFDENGSGEIDLPLRAQVISSPEGIKKLCAGRRRGKHSLDFMEELYTSPAKLVTRRYPLIAILKPVNTCAQICAYCQRNWEVASPLFPGAFTGKKEIEKAIEFIKKKTSVVEVLITGGDPLILPDDELNWLIGKVSSIERIERIRIGTRIPAVLPMRITQKLLDILEKYHELGKREICFVTHFQHPLEITPEVKTCIGEIRKRGMVVYNQAVFTFYNSRRFEMAALRRLIKMIGVDPYYIFVAKGKEETERYRVPIARVLQEINEEARLLPGIIRTDEPVFNIPRLGKNYIRSNQHHKVIMIHPDGSRFYEFQSWEKHIRTMDNYIFKDIPISYYLERLKSIGENVNEYKSIWYYF